MLPKRIIPALVACSAFWSQAGWAQPPAGDQPAAASRHALLIAVDQYAELNSLQYCSRDMTLLRQRLLASGFPEENVVLMQTPGGDDAQPPSRAAILHQLDLLLDRAGPHDLLVFAFSGHGVEVEGVSYLCPIEARLDAPEQTMIPLEEVYQKLAASRARQKLLVIDACRSDPRPGHERSIERATDSLTGFARALETAPEGIALLGSCAPGQVSIEDDRLGHGVFMYFLLRGLQGEADRDGGNRDGRVSLFELYRYVDRRTRAHVARSRDLLQTPILRSEIAGDFELTRLDEQPSDVEVVWAQIINEPERFAEDSPVLRDFLRRMLHMYSWHLMAQQTRAVHEDKVRDMMRRSKAFLRTMLRTPQAIVLVNPALITARDQDALLALQRAYAFGVAGDYDAAIAAASEAARLEPDNPFAYLLRAMAYELKVSPFAVMKSMRAQGAGRMLWYLADYSSTHYSSPAFRELILRSIDDQPALEPVIAAMQNPTDAVVLRAGLEALLGTEEAGRLAQLGHSRFSERDASIALWSWLQKQPQITKALEPLEQRLIQEVERMLGQCLELALADFQRAGVGGCYVIVNDGTHLRAGQRVVATVTDAEPVKLIRIQDEWYWVRFVRDGEPQEGWIRQKDILSPHAILPIAQYAGHGF